MQDPQKEMQEYKKEPQKMLKIQDFQTKNATLSKKYKILKEDARSLEKMLIPQKNARFFKKCKIL